MLAIISEACLREQLTVNPSVPIDMATIELDGLHDGERDKHQQVVKVFPCVQLNLRPVHEYGDL